MIIGQHYGEYYPSGVGVSAHKLFPDWDYTTCVGEERKAKWQFIGFPPIGYEEKECVLYFYPLWVKNLYFDKNDKPIIK